MRSYSPRRLGRNSISGRQSAALGLAGLAALALWLFFKSDSKWFHAWSLAVATMASDILVHPTHYGEHPMTEAVVTGLGAGLLAYLFHSAFPGKK